jgi:hypothetical protein
MAFGIEPVVDGGSDILATLPHQRVQELLSCRRPLQKLIQFSISIS